VSMPQGMSQCTDKSLLKSMNQQSMMDLQNLLMTQSKTPFFGGSLCGRLRPSGEVAEWLKALPC
ncbi:MAG: hypothetical protein P8H58_08430, partial [Luminiphilus sp.]|nr:hypothetical protein [Luminiphilus sp.]